MIRAPSRRESRRGLATLEMVLCLPILLMVMALMVNFGTLASWKVRGLTVARQAAWGNRSPRTTGNNPRPSCWFPASASTNQGGTADMPNQLDPWSGYPVVRGPLVGAAVRARLLDPRRGARHGSAGLQRRFPLLARLGSYDLQAQTHLLDNKWQFAGTSMWSNWQRRVPVIYELQQVDPALVLAYTQSVREIIYAPFREDLWPLDRDDEFIYYRNLFGWQRGIPDFHPRLPGPCGGRCRAECGLDRDTVQLRVDDLIDRIQGSAERNQDGTRRVSSLPQRMTRAFIRLYQNAIREFQNRIAADPPPTPGQIAAMQAEIRELEAKIDTLTRFLATVR